MDNPTNFTEIYIEFICNKCNKNCYELSYCLYVNCDKIRFCFNCKNSFTIDKNIDKPTIIKNIVNINYTVMNLQQLIDILWYDFNIYSFEIERKMIELNIHRREGFLTKEDCLNLIMKLII